MIGPGYCGEAEGVPLRSHVERSNRLRDVVSNMGGEGRSTPWDQPTGWAEGQATRAHLCLGPTQEQEAYARGRRDGLRLAAKELLSLLEDAARIDDDQADGIRTARRVVLQLAGDYQPHRVEDVAELATIFGTVDGLPKTEHLEFDEAGKMLPCACNLLNCTTCIGNVDASHKASRG